MSGWKNISAAETTESRSKQVPRWKVFTGKIERLSYRRALSAFAEIDPFERNGLPESFFMSRFGGK
jgi:hypothetical protein